MKNIWKTEREEDNSLSLFCLHYHQPFLCKYSLCNYTMLLLGHPLGCAFVSSLWGICWCVVRQGEPVQSPHVHLCFSEYSNTLNHPSPIITLGPGDICLHSITSALCSFPKFLWRLYSLVVHYPEPPFSYFYSSFSL